MMVYSIHVSVLLYEYIHTINISTYVYHQQHTCMHYHKYYIRRPIPTIILWVGVWVALPICTGEPHVTFIKLICTGEQPRVTFIKLICTGEQPRVTFIKLICTGEPHVTFNCQAYQHAKKATTKVHIFAQWTTTVPPVELTGPWDQGVLNTDGPSGHLRRNATTYNTHKS